MLPSAANAIIDENSGFFVMVQNIVFKLGLSTPAERCYIRLKWQAGGDLKPLPKQERYIARRIGVSRPAWNRAAIELLEAGLIYYTDKNLHLTDLIVINHQWSKKKLNIEKAKERIKSERGILGPKSGQNLGPKSGQKPGPKSGHMINNMKTNNITSIPASSLRPQRAKESKRDDDEKKSRFDLDTIRKYAEHLHTTKSRAVRNVEGLALSMFKTGADDSRISDWLAKSLAESQPKPEDPYAVFSRIVGLSLDLAKAMPFSDRKDNEHREGLLESGAITAMWHYDLMKEFALARLKNKHLGLPDELIEAKRKQFRKVG